MEEITIRIVSTIVPEENMPVVQIHGTIILFVEVFQRRDFLQRTFCEELVSRFVEAFLLALALRISGLRVNQLNSQQRREQAGQEAPGGSF